MARMRILTAAEQVAAHLRTEVLHGRMSGIMPGVLRLEAELGVNRNTLEAAMRHLESEGLLVPQGAGRRRKILNPVGKGAPHRLRVAILSGEAAEQRLDYVAELQHDLEETGHAAVIAPKTMVELGMNVKRIAGMVAQVEADAWVVMAGSREVLEWFSSQAVPAFALFGRRNGLPIPAVGPDKRPTYAAAVRELVRLGHRRIVLMARSRRILPAPGAAEKAFLDALAVHGLQVSDYNLPLWEETTEGFHARLDSLFTLTPPTALIIDEGPLFAAAQQFLAQRRLRVPEDVSMICTDDDPSFEWSKPAVSHIRWDSRPVVRRIVKWAENVSLGKRDLRQTLTPAEFVPGGTIGPAARG